MIDLQASRDSQSAFGQIRELELQQSTGLWSKTEVDLVVVYKSKQTRSLAAPHVASQTGNTPARALILPRTDIYYAILPILASRSRQLNRPAVGLDLSAASPSRGNASLRQ